MRPWLIRKVADSSADHADQLTEVDICKFGIRWR